eukprot:801969-Pelagomonas_calceolata.AAC.3
MEWEQGMQRARRQWSLAASCKFPCPLMWHGNSRGGAGLVGNYRAGACKWGDEDTLGTIHLS